MASVRLAPTRTDKVPNTSATAASSGADINGGAVKNACDQIRERLSVVAAGKLGIHPEDVRFVNGVATGIGFRDKQIAWAQLVHDAYFQRVQLWAAGYYRTAGLHWDAEQMQGEPFKYFAYGASVSEVEVDGFTGAYRLLRADIVHDVGDSLSPLIDIGQIEGGFVQGAGWLTLEELKWDESDGPHRGRLNTQAASTYKIPSFSEMPEEFNVHLFERATESGVVYGSKAVGEPPLMQAFSVREALRQAVGEFGPQGFDVELGCPSTPEAGLLGDRAGPGGGARVRRGPEESPRCWPGSEMDWLSAVQQLRRRGPARSAGHRRRGARPRAARCRRQDGRRHRPGLGQRRRWQPRGGGHHPGPRADRLGRARSRSGRSRRSPSTRPTRTASSAAAASSGCCSSPCRPGRRSRSSGSVTSATSWAGSCPGWRSSCTSSTRGRTSSTPCGWPM